MNHTNIEIKAKLNNHRKIRETLKSKNANFKGKSHQIDTYFNIRKGKLKLREEKIGNSLIYYDREDKKGPRQSSVTLFKLPPKSSLKKLLTRALGILVVVDKQREVYFIDNVEFHLDSIKDLGNFVEIEVTNEDSNIGKAKLIEQCQFFLDLFKISQNDLISSSYSDLLLKKK